MLMTDNNKKSVSNNRLRRVFRDELAHRGGFNETDFRVGEVLRTVVHQHGCLATRWGVRSADWRRRIPLQWPKWNCRVILIKGSALEISEEGFGSSKIWKIPYKDIREVIFSDPPPEVKKRPKSARKIGRTKK